MTSAIRVLPEPQSRALLDAYAATGRGKRQQTALGIAIVVGLALVSGWMAEVRPATFVANIANFTSYIAQLVPHLTLSNLPGDLAEWYWNLPKWLALLGETVLIAYLGTLIGTVGAVCLCFLGSANLVGSPWVRFGSRRFLEFCRTVPEIVFALIFVLAFGLGPVVGVMALAIHTTGALGKLFAELAENIDMKPVEGIRAAGASWTQVVRFAVLPQVLAGFASYALLRFEINVRAAGVMGFVGAGGIGMELLTAIRSFYYSDISAILLLIVGTVVVIDLLTERLRHVLMPGEARH